ncbi:ABCB family ABC transporter ATP-binding protein/permease [Ketogulonicigenium vulgare]|uniref:ABC transporter, ATP-binding/permease protein n=1 Tax=Ketogulonicigenium vulgare (strain WSH-001) TaxID=759362 RepID=F9Y564_KETVW|nr:ABC transporter ATP-binding protein/permease [Ketogulonicigenium vulgare]ADO42497.1 ABC transporter, ATP-binding/permease protein [Ketogulonicigenium vulgare Y25]AEM40696.1 ABC transporter, ATP-binding/permease protein [Ketogulonicigenium vulgare WSH-001]ALJ80865.1 metal ABC transporter permease [Ketogulonicigenium vulgare]ANW33642.1 metal ABC transporter permease [Ketogulonicigenium vulgare]AOZ54410.1 ABC transporter, ATP-binding/permease protein [Ketogulonicigenium vulgare]
MHRPRISITDASAKPVQGLSILRRVLPYLWPDGANWVKYRVVAALVLLMIAKLITVATPLFYKWAVDSLSGVVSGPAGMMALGAVGLTVAYGGARLLTVGFQQLRDAVFVRVGQRSLRIIAGQAFAHMHQLSMRYHITRKTGGLSRIMERGIKGVDFLLRMFVFSLGPLVLELVLVCATLFFLFDVRFLLVVAGTIAAYIVYTLLATEWRVRIRRKMNEQDNDANQKAIDSLLNFETVKYFDAETREVNRYDSAMEKYEDAAVKTGVSLAALNFGQSLIITLGLTAVMVLAAMGVQDGTMTVGDFVMVNAYMIQVTQPLNFLGTIYREIRQALVDMGQLFDLMGEAAEVKDKPGAPALRITGGEIRFEDVRFHYAPDREILKGVSFTVPAGKTLALVGATGSGKSTIGRLLFRFYDVTGGRILIDGQDIRDVTQESLHRAIGVVPQDTVLFNDTIGYNIGYGRAGATQAQIEDAARAAQVHDFIASLPEGYETQVGERGLKLSGGEKQRVGIARTLLKDAPLLLLDEATSALDTNTEMGVQEVLARAEAGRTTISIAHRLSTIADADEIIVLDHGAVVERGSHGGLLAQNGRYAQLWAHQQASDQD